jgi:REP element-mobilizing transposase RayT
MTRRIYVKSTRLQHWDYTSDAWYFVTICTRDRLPTLGQVIDGEMQLSCAGQIVSEEWLRTQDVRANVSVDEYVVMPNHLHGIIVVEESPARPQPCASQRDASTRRPRLYPNSLGSIIGQFKSVSTKRIWAAGFREFAWQPRFYDHIIRNEASLDAIRKYIRDNPVKWALDKDNLEGLRM